MLTMIYKEAEHVYDNYFEIINGEKKHNNSEFNKYMHDYIDKLRHTNFDLHGQPSWIVPNSTALLPYNVARGKLYKTMRRTGRRKRGKRGKRARTIRSVRSSRK